MADMYLKIATPDIAGESKDSKHTGEIEVLSFSWGVSQTAMVTGTGGSGVGKANFQDLSVTVYQSSASPLLMQNCAAGTHFAKMTLTARRAGGEQEAYLTIDLVDCFITSYQTSGSEGGGTMPMESMSIAFRSVTQTYTPQKDANGTGGTAVPGTWNLDQHTK